MARMQVRILETFEVVTRLGPLVVKTMTTGEEEVIDGPREVRHWYTKGEQHNFSNKKSALAFIKQHPGKAELA
jgi:hypothetical protein